MPDRLSETPSAVNEYIEGVRGEIRQLTTYFARRLRAFRAIRILVIVSAALVPTLAATSVPRGVLGALGAVAAVAEAIQELFQLRQSALHAMRGANARERILNRYLTGIEPFSGSAKDAFVLFAAKIEEVREDSDNAFLEVWQQAGETRPAAEAGNQRSLSDGQRS